MPDHSHPSFAVVTQLPAEGRARVRIESMRPSVDGGRHPVKRVVGDRLRIEVDLVGDGHDAIAGVLHVRAPGSDAAYEVPLQAGVGDRFTAELMLGRIGRWSVSVTAWVDRYATWQHGLQRKLEAGQDVELELEEGSALVREHAAAGDTTRRAVLVGLAERLSDRSTAAHERASEATAPATADAMRCTDPRRFATTAGPFDVVVDPEIAACSAWYELFPRSCGPGQRHGTLDDAAAGLARVASMGFDVVYLPPIHPIGITHRKGRNNSLQAGAEDPGSPWAIGGAEGGHTSIHPQLGNLDDFDRFVAHARTLGLQVALDIALQCSPDHPWVREHPQWFRRRPDGSIQYAENPPKKYQDVYPFDFETDDWRALWLALRDVFSFWVTHGVRIFRVDNPHTKPLPFWEWCIASIKNEHPDAIFLAEAFTRPKLKYHLAKLGFSQSYTYFTWRSTAWELRTYLEELTSSPVADFCRPNFWPNTPDILPEELQWGGRNAFACRLILAATLSGNYGIYGPAYELMDHDARPGSGEYLDNEKYEIKAWDVERADSLAPLVATINRIRRQCPALQQTKNVTFHRTDNEHLLAYSKRSGDDVVLVIVDLDHHHRQSGWIDLDLAALGVHPGERFQVHDMLGGSRFFWQGSRNYVEIDPHGVPAHVFRIRHHVRTERDFDYYL